MKLLPGICVPERQKCLAERANLDEFAGKSVVYILSCADNTLYTGWTNDLPRRLKAHNDGKGGKYTGVRRPVRIVYAEVCADKSAALKREAAIKKLSRKKKLALLTDVKNRL